MSFWSKKLVKDDSPTEKQEKKGAVEGGGASTGEGASSRTSNQPSTIEAPRFEKGPLASKNIDEVRSALGEGTVIQGKLSFDKPVRIDGKLSGEVFSSAALFVGPKGQIDAQVEVEELVIAGRVSGKVLARKRVEVRETASLDGEVLTPALAVQEGARVNIRSKMSRA